MSDQLYDPTTPVPPAQRTRPTSVRELVRRLDAFRTEASITSALAFQPRPSDVFVATFAKSGTTWMQQIVHGLRSGGDMDFAEISSAVPWLESALDMGIDAEADQVAKPRAFKTHLAWDQVPKGARYVCVVRDPRDVLVSFYHFFEGWMFEAGSVDMAEFARELFLAGASKSGRYWEHVASYWRERERPEVLMMAFEDIKADLDTAVRRVADFIDLPSDIDREARIAVATEQARFGFMKAHESQFDDHLLRDLREPYLGLPPGGTCSKVRSGRVGDHAGRLTPEVVAMLDEAWRESMAEPLGLASYAELRASLRP